MSKIFIISNSPVFRLGLKSMIDLIENCKVVAEGDSLIQVIFSYESQGRNIFMIDLDFIGIESLNLIYEIKGLIGKPYIIGFSRFSDHELVIKQFTSGINGLMDTACQLKDLRTGIAQVLMGKDYFMKPTSDIILQYCHHEKNEKRNISVKGFTPRELEIIDHVCHQRTAKEIGKLVFICEKTVDYHRQKILEKMKVKNIAGLVVFSIKNNLVDINEL